MFKGDLELVSLLVEALLADDAGLEERRARAYQNAIAGTWPRWKSRAIGRGFSEP